MRAVRWLAAAAAAPGVCPTLRSDPAGASPGMRLLGTIQSQDEGYIEHWKGAAVTAAQPLEGGVVATGYTTGSMGGAIIGEPRPADLSDYDGFVSYIDTGTGAIRWTTQISFNMIHHVPWTLAVNQKAAWVCGLQTEGAVPAIGGLDAMTMLTLVMGSKGFALALDVRDGSLLWNEPLEGPVGAVAIDGAGTTLFVGGRANGTAAVTALDAASGAALWVAPVVGGGCSGLHIGAMAYDEAAQLIFVTNLPMTVVALSAVDGAVQWCRSEDATGLAGVIAHNGGRVGGTNVPASMVYIAGSVSSPVPGPRARADLTGPTPIPGAPFDDAFVAAFRAADGSTGEEAGERLWAWQMGTEIFDRATGAAFDPVSRMLYVIGYTTDVDLPDPELGDRMWLRGFQTAPVGGSVYQCEKAGQLDWWTAGQDFSGAATWDAAAARIIASGSGGTMPGGGRSRNGSDSAWVGHVSLSCGSGLDPAWRSVHSADAAPTKRACEEGEVEDSGLTITCPPGGAATRVVCATPCEVRARGTECYDINSPWLTFRCRLKVTTDCIVCETDTCVGHQTGDSGCGNSSAGDPCVVCPGLSDKCFGEQCIAEPYEPPFDFGEFAMLIIAVQAGGGLLGIAAYHITLYCLHRPITAFSQISFILYRIKAIAVLVDSVTDWFGAFTAFMFDLCVGTIHPITIAILVFMFLSQFVQTVIFWFKRRERNEPAGPARFCIRFLFQGMYVMVKVWLRASKLKQHALQHRAAAPGSPEADLIRDEMGRLLKGRDTEQLHESFLEQLPQAILQAMSIRRLCSLEGFQISKLNFIILVGGPCLSILMLTHTCVKFLRVWGFPTLDDILMRPPPTLVDLNTMSRCADLQKSPLLNPDPASAARFQGGGGGGGGGMGARRISRLERFQTPHQGGTVELRAMTTATPGQTMSPLNAYSPTGTWRRSQSQVSWDDQGVVPLQPEPDRGAWEARAATSARDVSAHRDAPPRGPAPRGGSGGSGDSAGFAAGMLRAPPNKAGGRGRPRAGGGSFRRNPSDSPSPVASDRRAPHRVDTMPTRVVRPRRTTVSRSPQQQHYDSRLVSPQDTDARSITSGSRRSPPARDPRAPHRSPPRHNASGLTAHDLPRFHTTDEQSLRPGASIGGLSPEQSMSLQSVLLSISSRDFRSREPSAAGASARPLPLDISLRDALALSQRDADAADADLGYTRPVSAAPDAGPDEEEAPVWGGPQGLRSPPHPDGPAPPDARQQKRRSLPQGGLPPARRQDTMQGGGLRGGPSRDALGQAPSPNDALAWRTGTASFGRMGSNDPAAPPGGAGALPASARGSDGGRRASHGDAAAAMEMGPPRGESMGRQLAASTHGRGRSPAAARRAGGGSPLVARPSTRRPRPNAHPHDARATLPQGVQGQPAAPDSVLGLARHRTSSGGSARSGSVESGSGLADASPAAGRAVSVKVLHSRRGGAGGDAPGTSSM